MNVEEIVKRIHEQRGASQNEMIYVIEEYIAETRNTQIKAYIRTNNSIILSYDVNLLNKAYSYAEAYYLKKYGITS